MKVYRSLGDIRLQNTSIAIGVFDGVHRGHQAVLRQTHLAASRIPGGSSLVFTFDRHPAEVIAPRYSPFYISSLSQKLELIEKLCPTDSILVLPFDLKFANLTAHEFVQQVLIDRLGARTIFVGADFRYGKDRQGGVMNLQASGSQHGFAVEVIPSVAEAGERVSSTRIRSLIANGQVAAASTLLGHQFAVRGRVVEGKKLGRTIGYPTANLLPEQQRQLLPIAGVYAARVRLEGEIFGKSRWPAAVSVGINPTTDGENSDIKIEAYIMDGFNQNLYGSLLDIEFVEFLRHEEKFDSLSSLVSQIDRDVEAASKILAV